MEHYTKSDNRLVIAVGQMLERNGFTASAVGLHDNGTVYVLGISDVQPVAEARVYVVSPRPLVKAAAQ
jgi:hypothetical protein